MTEGQTELYIVTANDSGDTCDGHSRAVYACGNIEEASNYIKKDMEDWIKRRKKEYPEVILDIDWYKHEINDEDSNGCIWDIHVLTGIDNSKKWFETQNNLRVRSL